MCLWVFIISLFNLQSTKARKTHDFVNLTYKNALGGVWNASQDDQVKSGKRRDDTGRKFNLARRTAIIFHSEWKKIALLPRLSTYLMETYWIRRFRNSSYIKPFWVLHNNWHLTTLPHESLSTGNIVTTLGGRGIGEKLKPLKVQASGLQ